MLVKGSYYTGTDDGAVNLIKLDEKRYPLIAVIICLIDSRFSDVGFSLYVMIVIFFRVLIHSSHAVNTLLI